MKEVSPRACPGNMASDHPTCDCLARPRSADLGNMCRGVDKLQRFSYTEYSLNKGFSAARVLHDGC